MGYIRAGGEPNIWRIAGWAGWTEVEMAEALRQGQLAAAGGPHVQYASEDKPFTGPFGTPSVLDLKVLFNELAQGAASLLIVGLLLLLFLDRKR